MLHLNLQHHFSLTQSQNVGQICNEILNSIGITYFNYLKIYQNGSRELLTNNAAWIDHFYQQGLFANKAVIDIEYLFPKGYFLWSELKTHDKAYTDGREYFNIDHGITFIFKNKTSTTLYIFASTRDNYNINHFLIKNIDLLKRFILFFKDRAYSLLKLAEKNLIILPQKQIIPLETLENIQNQQLRKNFINKTSIKRFYFQDSKENNYLTKREAECATFITQGLTAKQIAKHLGISSRTVECYIDKIKQKLNFKSKDDLLTKIIDANIYETISQTYKMTR